MEDRGEINTQPATEAPPAPYEDKEKTAAVASVVTTIDPEIEKRVVRKLDLRIPTLTAFLCTFNHAGRVLTVSELTMAAISPTVVLGSEQHRVFTLFHCCVRICILTFGRNAKIAGMETDLN